MSNQPTSSPQQPKPECRALVVVAPAPCRPAERPQAAFVTQLIACERRIGAYRTARRAASGEAAVLYAGWHEAAAPGSFQRVV